MRSWINYQFECCHIRQCLLVLLVTLYTVVVSILDEIVGLSICSMRTKISLHAVLIHGIKSSNQCLTL